MTVPFSIYDFFAYLSSGAVLMITADYIWELGLLHQKDIGPALGLALLILCYVIGQIIAHLSAFLFEHLLIFRILKSPAHLLIGGNPRSRLIRWVFPNYHRPLSPSTQARIRQQATSRSCSAEGEGLFQHAYPLVTAIDRYQSRLDEFRNQYGFARNASFAFLVSALAICLAHIEGSNNVRMRWAALAAFAGLSLFYRYLKFFRQYSYELFLRYSELPQSETKATAVSA